MKNLIKIPLLLLGLAIISAIVHNAIYALFEVEEPVFFILTFVFLLGAIVFAVYKMIRSLIGQK